MANDIIGIVVTDNSDNVQLNVTPNLVTINVSQTSGNIIGSNYFLANNYAALPVTGESTTLYITNDTSLMYRWSVSAYVQVNSVTSWGTIAGTLSSQTDLQNALNLKAPLASPTFTGTVTGVTKTMVGLSNVDNTSDVNKPVSTANQTALDLKSNINNPTFTGTVGGVTKAMVGLGNVDNTTDLNKPISTATQSSLDTKAPIASPTFTGTVGGITKSMVGLSNVDNTTDLNKPISTATQTAIDLKANTTDVTNSLALKAPLASPTFTGTVSGITKTMVGLANVDNTTDANKPISTATQTALDLKAPLASPTFTGTVSGITKSMVGLENVDNTTDLLKPISTATQTALNLKYDASNPSGYTTNVGTVTSVGGTGTVSGLSLSGSVTTSGNLTLGGTLSLTSGNVTGALGFTPENAAIKGIANGYASLDGGGLVPSTQLPSYVDDVLEFANLAALPATGETGKIYVTLDTNKIYRWSGATYIEVSPTVGTIWGGITGTLANQTDLQNALNAKQASLTGTGFVVSTSGTITYDTSTYYLASNPNSYIALTALSSTATGLTYTNTTGVFSLTGGYAIPTTASATNWDTAYTNRITSLTVTGSSGASTLVSNVLNIPTYTLSGLGGQVALNGTGFVKISGTTISYDNSTYLTTASASSTYQTIITNPITGTGTINELAYFTASGTIASLPVATYPSLTELSYVKGVTSAIQTQLNAKQSTITLTTTGTSGAATFSANTLNIPNYGSALSGYLPLTGGTLTGALIGTTATFSGNLVLSGSDARINGGDSVGRLLLTNSNTTTYIGLYGATHPTLPYIFSVVVNSAAALSIASTGAATFSSSVTASSLLAPEKASTIFGINAATSSGNGGSLTIKAGNGSGAGNTSGSLNLGFGRGGAGALSGSMNFGVAQATDAVGLDATYMTITSTGNVEIGAYVYARKGTSGVAFTTSNGVNADWEVETTSGGLTYMGTSGNLMAINRNGGSVVIGRTTAGLINTTGTTLSAGSIQAEGNSYVFYGNRTSSDGLFMGIRRNNVDVGSITVTTSATAFNTSSDYRLKTDFKDYSGLSLINSIKTYDYAWAIDNSRAYGVKAHELQELLPYMVFGEKDAINEDNSVKPQAVDYSKLVPILVKAIQELSAEITILKNK